MFDYIKGTLERKAEGYVVLDVGGIGYKLSTSLQSLQKAGNPGEKATFYTYLYIREEILELYGFASAEERATFELLISVSGVGPKAALNILSCVSSANLALAIVTNDTKTITKAQGVGPKLAQRIILELKDKIKTKDLVAKDDGFVPEGSLDNDAVDALIVLGYTQADAVRAIKDVPEGTSLEDTIKFALKQLMKY